jgi:peroxiredoxin
MPLINSAYARHKHSLRVLAVDLQEPASEVDAFTRRYGISFSPLLDSTGSVWNLYRLSVSGPKPVTFWIGRDGVIRSVHYGQMGRQDVTNGLHAVGL